MYQQAQKIAETAQNMSEINVDSATMVALAKLIDQAVDPLRDDMAELRQDFGNFQNEMRQEMRQGFAQMEERIEKRFDRRLEERLEQYQARAERRQIWTLLIGMSSVLSIFWGLVKFAGI